MRGYDRPAFNRQFTVGFENFKMMDIVGIKIVIMPHACVRRNSEVERFQGLLFIRDRLEMQFVHAPVNRRGILVLSPMRDVPLHEREVGASVTSTETFT